MKKLLSILILVCLILVGYGVLNNQGIGRKTDTTNSKDNKETKQEVKDTKISFIGVGDNLLHQTISEQADGADGVLGDKKYDYRPQFSDIKDDIASADLAFINQETILGGYELGLSGYPSFNSPADVAYSLKDLGFDIVNTASNHSLDRSQKGINNSSATWLKQEGVITSGTYTSQKDRDTIRMIERKGIKFSFLAYTYGTNGVEPPHSYSVAYFDEAKIREDVAKAKKLSDVVIVSAHWGEENTNTPSDYQKQYAQLLADLHVDVVIGTHPHVIQPVEWISGKDGNSMPVVYSLGNVMSGMLDVNNVLSGMIKFDFIKDGKTNAVRVENLKWEPLVTHYSGDASNITSTRKHFSVYKLRDYSAELSAQHGLNGYNNQSISISDLYKRTQAVIKKIPIIK